MAADIFGRLPPGDSLHESTSRRSAKSSSSAASSNFRSNTRKSPHVHHTSATSQQILTCDDVIEVKSKFDAEFRRFSISRLTSSVRNVGSFIKYIEQLHNLSNVPFTLCYTDVHGDLLPINNDDNFRKALESARPVLRILVQRKGESLEERYGYGTTSDSFKKKNRISRFLGNVAAGGVANVLPGVVSSTSSTNRPYDISMPQDFRQVSAIIDVDVVPETHRRVRLCKHGSDKPLGFYIRDGTSIRVTSQGILKVPGIFISRLVPGGLAESTGLLAVNDEVLEVNGIEVLGKTLDQVTDMMVANASNLVITVRPCDQSLTLAKNQRALTSRDVSSSNVDDHRPDIDNDEDSEDEIRDMLLPSNVK